MGLRRSICLSRPATCLDLAAENSYASPEVAIAMPRWAEWLAGVATGKPHR